MLPGVAFFQQFVAAIGDVAFEALVLGNFGVQFLRSDHVFNDLNVRVVDMIVSHLCHRCCITTAHTGGSDHPDARSQGLL